MAGTSRRYPQELKDRAVQMVIDSGAEAGTEWVATCRVAELLGIGSAETVRKWVRQAEVNRGHRADRPPRNLRWFGSGGARTLNSNAATRT